MTCCSAAPSSSSWPLLALWHKYQPVSHSNYYTKLLAPAVGHSKGLSALRCHDANLAQTGSVLDVQAKVQTKQAGPGMGVCPEVCVYIVCTWGESVVPSVCVYVPMHTYALEVERKAVPARRRRV